MKFDVNNASIMRPKSPGGKIDASLMDPLMTTMIIQAQIFVFCGFSLMVTDRWTDGRTHPLKEMRGRILKTYGAIFDTRTPSSAMGPL